MYTSINSITPNRDYSYDWPTTANRFSTCPSGSQIALRCSNSRCKKPIVSSHPIERLMGTANGDKKLADLKRKLY